MTRIAVGGSSPSGLRWPHFVNGRLLTAQDLDAGQDAVFGRDRWLGTAIGPGVVEGLEVTGSSGSSVLQVSPGTGVSPGGTAVHLDVPATLDLTVVSSSAPVEGDRFADCRPPSTSTKAPTAGAYVLVMQPASRYDGKVPVQGSPNATLPTPCTSRWEVEDVVFAAIRLDDFTATTTADNRRNLLAHWCYGSDHLAELALSGFTEPLPFRGLDGVADLGACDLPLAVFDWDGSALTFVDRWAARRRVVRPSAATTLAPIVGDDRAADGEARFLQFQEQLDGLLATPAGRDTQARLTFPMLPPAGIVPIDPIRAAKRLLADEPDFTVGAVLGPGAAPVAHAVLGTATTSPAFSRLGPMHRVLLGRELGELDEMAAVGEIDEVTLLGEVTEAERSMGRLGEVSRQLRHVNDGVEALRKQVDDLTEQVRGGGRGSSTAREEGRRLAADLVEVLADTAGDGVDPGTFFRGMRVRVGVVDHETVDFTIRRSWYDEPVPVGRNPMLNVFFIWSADAESVAPYLLFAKRQRGIRWIDTTGRSWKR